MASSQDALLIFSTALRGFHVQRSCWKPYVKQKIEFRKEKNNQYDKYAVVGCTKLPGKMVLRVAGHMPRKISRYTQFSIKGSVNITAQVISTNTKRSPLTQGGLEIEIKVTVIWENKKNRKIFAEKVDSVHSRQVNRIRMILKTFCMKSSERRTMHVCLYLRTKNQKIKLNFVLFYCVLEKKNF